MAKGGVALCGKAGVEGARIWSVEKIRLRKWASNFIRMREIRWDGGGEYGKGSGGKRQSDQRGNSETKKESFPVLEGRGEKHRCTRMNKSMLHDESDKESRGEMKES